VALGGTDGVGEVAQQRLVAAEAAGLGDGELERIARDLLDDLALRAQHEGGVDRDLRDGTAHRAEHDAEDQQQQQQVQDLAQPVEATEQTAEELPHELTPAGTPACRCWLIRPSLRCAPPCPTGRAGST
ncbi:MAG: hypothetical protein ACK559_03425, partial [bacterium]